MVDWKVLLFLKFRRSYVLLVCFPHQAKTTYEAKDTGTRNPKQPCINGCFKWIFPNIYIENGGLAKHPFETGCLGFQVSMHASHTSREEVPNLESCLRPAQRTCWNVGVPRIVRRS